MARDEQLYTGMSNAVVRNVRRESLEKKLEAKVQLKPYQEVVFAEIEKIKTSLLQAHRTIVFADKTDETVRFDLEVLRARLADLSTLQNKLNMILKAEK